MPVYRDEKNNTWKVYYRYTDWDGTTHQSTKRGFKTKRDAQAWEREQHSKSSGNLDMTFRSFAEQYTEDMKSRTKKYLGYQRTYHANQAATLLRQAENEQHHAAADYPLAE